MRWHLAGRSSHGRVGCEMTGAQAAAADPSGPGGGSLPRVRLNGVTKRFLGTTALNDVSLEIAPGEIHALAGGNGCGKSTLIKILAGVHGADAGELAVDGVAVPLSAYGPEEAKASGMHFVHQEPSVFSDLTVAENLSIGRGFETRRGLTDRAAIRRRCTQVLSRFGIECDPDDALGDLSPSQQTMVAIARALQDQEHAGSGLLVLDEPTAALPDREVQRLLEALRRYAADGQSILLVSHRLSELLDVADRITVFRDGVNVADGIAPSIGHDALVELIVGRDVEAYSPREPQESSGAAVLSADGITGGVVRDVSFAVGQGEIVGVTGLLGSGCSTLLRLIYGDQRIEAGAVTIAGKVSKSRTVSASIAEGVCFVPPDRKAQALLPDESVRANITIASLRSLSKRGVLRRRAELRGVAMDFERFSIRAGSMEMPVAQLSGGNQQKVVLARWLRRDPKLLLLDEPTQGVDAGARAEIWQLVDQAIAGGAGVLTASTDIEELATVAHRVLVMDRGRLVHELSGPDLNPDTLARLMHADTAEPR